MTWETEIASVENYYADLLIIQYRNKPKARATIKLGANLYLADGLVFDLQNVLDIDTAKGAQLDLIGKILGQNRNIFGFNIDKDYFTFEKIGALGYSDKNALSKGLWKKYGNSIGSAFALDDEDYRLLLKFKALYNLRRGSWKELDELYYRIFGNSLRLQNNKDLSITIVFNLLNNSTIIQLAKFLGYFAPPLGINYDYDEYLLWSESVQDANLGSNTWASLTYGLDNFLALGYFGYISTSSDGTTWTAATQNSNLGNNNWIDVKYVNGKFYALGSNGYLSTSVDGVNWDIATQNSNLSSNTMIGFIHNGSNFVAIARNTNSNAVFYSTSNDFITWTAQTSISLWGGLIPAAITYGNNKFVLVSVNGYVSTSTDGTTWNQPIRRISISGSDEIRELIYANNYFIVLTKSGQIATSNDAVNWSNLTSYSELGSKNWTALSYGNNKLVAIGLQGYVSISE